jgi:hypothetical protein
MLDQANDAGYIIYILMIFLPGIGLGELLGVWRTNDSLIERLAFSFGLGISVDTVVLLVRTSNILGLKGMDTTTIYVILLSGVVFLGASIGIRRRLSFPTKLTKTDMVVFIIILAQVSILLLYFQKYPIFPQYQSEDFSAHVKTAEGLISGTIVSIPSGILYFGVHFQIGSTILLVGGEPLVTARQTMAILISLSPLIFYYAAKRIFSNNTAVALIVVAVYVFSGTIWYASVLDSGLYANFFGLLAVLFLLIALTNLVTNYKSIPAWIVFLIAVVDAFMSHYTALSILPAIVALPLIEAVINKKKWPDVKAYAYPAIILVIPLAIPFLVFPNLEKLVVSVIYQSTGNLSGSTFLSGVFSSFPVISYLALEFFDDVAFVAVIVLAIVYFYDIITTKKPYVFSFVPLIWFFSLIIAAPIGIIAWRFSYEAIVPLILMASYGLASLLPVSARQAKTKSVAQRAKSGQQGSLIPRILVILIFFGAIIIGSWGQTMLSDAATNQNVASQSQTSVYNAINWLNANTNSSSRYLSVSDWRFTFTNLIIGRNTLYQYERLPSDAIKQAENSSAGYVIVTNITTLSLPPVAEFYPWNNFPSSSNSNLTLIYQNSDVRIYHIVNSS